MINIENLVRDNIKSLSPYSSARSEFNKKNHILLDANENPFGIYNRYPDPQNRELKRNLSRTKNVESQSIFLGNGSDEIIDLLFRIFCRPAKDKVICMPPTYGMYEVSAAINDIEVLSVPLNALFQIDMERLEDLLSNTHCKMIFLCSPNNPSGNSLNKADVLKVLRIFNGIVVLDEAYIDFGSSQSLITEIDNYDNLIVLQTFSKAWGMAGLRMGSAFSNEKIIAYLNKVKPPYNLSSSSQRLAINTLRNAGVVKMHIKTIIEQREALAKELENLDQVVQVYPSEANFLLVEFQDAEAVYKGLIEQGIVTRNRSTQINNCLRIGIGKPRENRLLLKALKAL